MVNIDDLKYEIEFIDNRIDQGHLEKTKDFLEKIKKVPVLTRDFDVAFKRLIIVVENIQRCLNTHQENFYYSNLDEMNHQKLEDLDILIENLNMNLSDRRLIIETIFRMFNEFSYVSDFINDFFIEYESSLFYNEKGELIDIIQNNYHEDEWIAINFDKHEFMGHNKSRNLLMSELKNKLKDVHFFHCAPLER